MRLRLKNRPARQEAPPRNNKRRPLPTRRQTFVPVEQWVARSASLRADNVLTVRFLLWALVQLGVDKEPPRSTNVTFNGNVRDFAKVLGLPWYVKNLQDVRDAVLSLPRVHFTFPAKRSVVDVPVVASVRRPAVVDEQGDIEIKFNPKLFEIFRRDELGFALLCVEDIYRVRSMRAVSLLLLLSSMRHMNSDVCRTLSVRELRFALNLEGPGYDRWDNLWTALSATRDFIQRDLANWRFDMRPIKSGRRVAKVRFDITRCIKLEKPKRRRSLTTTLLPTASGKSRDFARKS